MAYPYLRKELLKMFVMSMHSSKVKIICVIVIVALCLGGAVIFAVKKSERADSRFPVNLRGSTEVERMDFLRSCGIEVAQEPLEISEIIIPAEFDEVYKDYNEIQVSQGFDLSAYSGKRVKRWTYKVTNYPGYAENSDAIRANLLVYDGLIIGGDVCSVELNGFIHGFIKDGKNTQTSDLSSTLNASSSGSNTNNN